MTIEKIIDITDLRITRKRHSYSFMTDKDGKKECDHSEMHMEDHGNVVTCKLCGVQVSPYWALQFAVEKWNQYLKFLKRKENEVNDAKQHNFHLIAVKKVESAWRSKMAIACPHCRMGILPEDGLGDHMMNREIEIKRRTVEAENAKKNA